MLRALVADLKHDLAKAVAWRTANYEDARWPSAAEQPDPELVEALQADILRTHRGRAAWEVWRSHTASLPRPLQEPHLARVEAAVARLEGHAEALRAGELAGIHEGLRAAQHTIRDALRELHRALLTR